MKLINPIGFEKRTKHNHAGGGAHSTMDSILALYPAAPGSILGVPKIFSDFIFLGLEFLDVVEIYRQQCTA